MHIKQNLMTAQASKLIYNYNLVNRLL